MITNSPVPHTKAKGQKTPEAFVRRKQLISMNAYGAGDMLGGAIVQLTSLYYLPFLLLVVGMRPVFAGIVIAAGRIWDGITDPVMGVIVDRTRTRYGSCRPFFLIAAVPILIGNVLLWSAWGIQGELAQFVYFIFAYMFYSTALTIGLVPYEALLPKMVNSYKERRSHTNLRPFYATITAIASVYLYEVLINATQDNPLSPAFQGKFTLLGIILGVMFATPLIITFFGTKETYLPPLYRYQKQTFIQALKESLREYREVLSSKAYRKYFSLVLLGIFVQTCVMSTMALLVYVVYGNIGNFILGFTLLFTVVNLKGACEIFFMLPNLAVTQLRNKHTPYFTDLPLLAASSVIVLFLTPSTPIWVFLTAMCLLGAGISCIRPVPLALLPDLTDVYELMYGRRAEGINAGLNTLGRKVVEGFTIALLGFILGMFGLSGSDLNFNPDNISTGALSALKIVFGILPIIACAVMIVISFTYRLDEKRHNMIKAVIREKRENGSVTITGEQKLEIEKITGKKFDDLWISKAGLSDDDDSNFIGRL